MRRIAGEEDAAAGKAVGDTMMHAINRRTDTGLRGDAKRGFSTADDQRRLRFVACLAVTLQRSNEPGPVGLGQREQRVKVVFS